MVTLEIYIFQSSVKMTTQGKPLPFVTEQTTQIYIYKELNNYTTKAKRALLTVQNRPSTCWKYIFFF